MPISVQCSFCNKKYRVRDELAGKNLTCKECGAELRIPGGDALGLVELIEDDGPQEISARGGDDDWERSFGGRGTASRASLPPRRRGAARRGPASNKSVPPFVWILVAAGGAVAGVAVLVTTLLMRPNAKVPQPLPPIGPQNPMVAPNHAPAGFPNPGMPGIERFPNPKLPDFPNPPPAARPNRNAANGGAQAANAGAPAANAGAPAARSAPKPLAAPGGLKPTALAGAAADVEPWNVSVDPAPAFDQEAAGGKKIRLTFPKNSQADVLYPECPSPMVALGSNNNVRESREVRDLRTNRKLGTMKGLQLAGGRFALSPDGNYIAAWIFTQKALYVWNVKAEKPLGELSFDAGGFLKFLAFAGNNRLVACGNDGILQVWSIPSGDGERSIELPKFFKEQTLAVSPGGKYLLLMDGDFSKSVIRAYDLATGKTAGEILVTINDVSLHNCKAVEFSADGTELAVLFEKGAREAVLAVYGVAAGELLEEIEFADELRSKYRSAGGRDRVLEWFPNKQRWLVYGLGLVDRQARQLIWSMPDLQNPGAGRFSLARKPFDDEHLLVVDAEKNDVVLLGYELPQEEIARSASVVAAGGLRVDANLPPLTAADLSGAAPLAAEGGAPAWEASLDPAEGHDRTLLEKPLVLPGRTGTLKGAMLSGPAAGRAVLLYAGDAAQRQGRTRSGNRTGASGPAWLSVIDLAAAKEAASISLPYAGDLLAVSVDGTRACTRLAEGETRLDLFSLEQGEHIVGFRPYQSEKENEQKVKAAVFIDNDHLLTQSAREMLVLWKLPECKAIYRLEKAQNPGVSPNRGYLALSNGRAYRLFDAKSGRPRGDLPARGLLQASAFHPDGARLATVTSDAGGDHLTSWNLATGQPEAEFPLPAPGRLLHWCGDQHLLIENTMLVDLPHKMVVWNYALAPGGGVHVADSPDARHWYLAGGFGNAPVTLVAASLPDAAALKVLAGARLEPDYVIQPGAGVSLRVNLANTPPGKPGFPQEVQKALAASLERNRVRIQDGQPVVVTASMAHRNTGKSNEYNVQQFGGRAGFNQQKVSVAEQVVECAVQIWRGNAVVWESKTQYSNSAFIFQVQQGKSVEQYLNEQMWNGAANFMLNFALPPYVLPAESVKGLGTSRLTADGPA